MSEEDLRIRIRLIDARLAQVEAEKTGKAVQGIGTSAKKAGAESEVASKKFGLMGHATGALKSALAFTGVAGLVFGIKDAVHAGITWQEQQAQLRVALGKTADGMEKLKEVNEAVERSATHGGFAPAEETQGITKFTRLTGDATKAIDLNQAAIDLARGAHISYAQATKLLSSATVGQVRGLQKFVGVIPGVTTHVDALKAAQTEANDTFKAGTAGMSAQEKAALGLTGAQKVASPEALKHAKALDKQSAATAAVQKVTEKFGGATDAYGKTAAGALSNAENSVDLLKESLGKELLPVVTKGADALTKFLGQMQSGKGAGGDFAKELKNIGREIGPPLKDMLGIGLAVGKFVGEHPALAKIAGDLIAVGLAVKTIRFAGSITGVGNLLTGLGRVPAAATRANRRVEETFSTGAGTRRGRLWGTAFGRAGELAIAGTIVADAPNILAQIGDSLLGKGNAFSEEARTRGWKDAFSIFGLMPEETSAHDTVSGRTPQQQRNRLRDPNYRAYLRRNGIAPPPVTKHDTRRKVTGAISGHNRTAAAGGTLEPGDQMQIAPGTTLVAIDGRVIAEATTKYTLKKQARR